MKKIKEGHSTYLQVKTSIRSREAEQREKWFLYFLIDLCSTPVYNNFSCILSYFTVSK
ncbi:unnamed protein product, partial [Larinioides sclopetarius]